MILANIKALAVIGVAVAMVIGVSVSFSSYVSEFENVQDRTPQTFRTIALGSASATVTIVEVGDYQCEMCKLWFEKTRPQIIDNYVDTGKVNLIFIDMPFLGQDSLPAAVATYCADDQDKYWDYHVALYEHQEGIDSGWASNERLKVFAFTLDLNMDQFSLCLDSNRYYQEVKQNFNKAKNLGVQSTPTFFILNTSGDQEIIRGAQPYSVFEQVIESLL